MSDHDHQAPELYQWQHELLFPYDTEAYDHEQITAFAQANINKLVTAYGWDEIPGFRVVEREPWKRPAAMVDYLESASPDNQQKAVDIAREQLEVLGVDISDMPDRKVVTHLVVLQEIAENRGMIIDDALAEYAHKFDDLGELTTEVMSSDEGTRH